MIQSPWSCVAVQPPFPHLLGCGNLDLLLATPGRTIAVNGEQLEGDVLAEWAAVEEQLGFRLMTGHYWYDPRCGAFGRVGQPTAGFLPVGLELCRSMAPNCSGGGTGIHVNGRELHDADRRALEHRLGVLPRGRYWLAADGSLGPMGGAARWQLGAAARDDAA